MEQVKGFALSQTKVLGSTYMGNSWWGGNSLELEGLTGVKRIFQEMHFFAFFWELDEKSDTTLGPVC